MNRNVLLVSEISMSNAQSRRASKIQISSSAQALWGIISSVLQEADEGAEGKEVEQGGGIQRVITARLADSAETNDTDGERVDTRAISRSVDSSSRFLKASANNQNGLIGRARRYKACERNI